MPTGRISVHPRGFGFLNLDEATAFIIPPDLNPFLDGDLVSATITPADGGRFNATGLKLVERTRTELFGTVTYHGRKSFLRVDRLVSNTDWPMRTDLPEGTAVVARLDDRGRLEPLRVVEEGADLGLERCVARHGIRSQYPEFKLPKPRPGERRDLRDLPTVTIDAPTTTDIDDALAALPPGPDGALRVLVSIADVGAWVEEGSALDTEARLRGTSVYLAGRVIPMLPDALSSEAVSLLPHVDRLALTAELRIGPEGDVLSVDVYESRIRSHARLSYEAVSEYLLTRDDYEIPREVAPTLRLLRTAAARLAAVRAARGGVELAREEAYVSFDPATREPTGLSPRGETIAHRLVERLMVAANEAIARWLVERGQPGMFRVHDEPKPEKVAELAESARNLGIEAGFGPRLTPRGLAAFEAQFRDTSVAPALRTVLGHALGPARYTVKPGAHFGLGAPLYLHFTSPIRRYADLVVHRIVKRYLAGDRSQTAEDPVLEEVAQHLNRVSLAASKAENERHRMLVARLFASRVGEELRGNVVAIKPFGLVVQMVGTGATGTVELRDHDYEIGEEVDVVIAGTNEELGRVELALA